jgi:hypothetical protein
LLRGRGEAAHHPATAPSETDPFPVWEPRSHQNNHETTMEQFTMKRRQLFGLFLAATLVAPFSAVAENSTSVGGYTIHHNAFTSDTLTPAIANAYGFQRSKYRGLLNVSVIKEEAGTMGKSVPANVDAKILTLMGQTSRLPMREIEEGDEAVYYIGEFPVHDEQVINFVIEVTPQGTAETYTIRMDHQFFTE